MLQCPHESGCGGEVFGAMRGLLDNVLIQQSALTGGGADRNF